MGEQDSGAGITKWKRLQIAFASRQTLAPNSRTIQEFIHQAMAPADYLSTPGRHEAMRLRLNQALLLAGF